MPRIIKHRFKFDSDKGAVVDVVDEAKKRREAFHNVISDEMPLTKHPITGEYIDSKSKFREITKAHGYTEVGNDYVNYNPENDKQPENTEFIDRFLAYERGEASDRVREIQNYLERHGHRRKYF